MFPNLSYFLYYFTGIEPDGALSIFKTYGFFLVVGIVCGMVIFKSELRRKEKLGLFGNHEAYDGQGYKGIFTQHFLNVHMIFAVFVAFIGAKLITLLDKIPELIESPVATISQSGTAAYGGIIFGFFASFLYFKRSKVPMLPVLDTMGPVLMLSNGIVRLGCYFSGDGCWGINAAQKPSWWFLPDWSWESYYPNNIKLSGVVIDGCTFYYNRILENPVHPTSLYESVICFLMFGLLWALRKRAFNAGFLFGIFLILNGIERFSIEFIRVTHKYSIWGFNLSQAQIITLFLFSFGLIWCFITVRKPNSAGSLNA